MGKVETRLHGYTEHLKPKVDVGKLLSDEYFEQEREKIFRKAWLPLCHTSDVPERGSYVVQEIPTFKASLLVVRGDDDKVRVFHNACRHRGNKLVREGAGKVRNFSCHFHGWVFSPEGALKLVTDEHQFVDLDKTALDLVEVKSQVWENLIFINLDAGEPRYTLEEWLGEGFWKQYDNGYWDLHEHTSTYVVTVEANWHLCVNSFVEGYHTLYIHKNTARDYQGGKINPQRHRPHMEIMKRHHRYSAPGNPDHRILPVEAMAIKHGRKMIPAFDFDFSMLPAGVNPSRYEYWAFDVIELFPNMVLITGNHFRAELIFWPIDERRTLVINTTYAYKTKSFGERLSRDYFRARGRDVAREDLSTLEAQQLGMEAAAFSHILLSRQETALKHHFAVTQEMVAAGEAA